TLHIPQLCNLSKYTACDAHAPARIPIRTAAIPRPRPAEPPHGRPTQPALPRPPSADARSRATTLLQVPAFLDCRLRLPLPSPPYRAAPDRTDCCQPD